MARTPMGRRELQRREKRRWELIEGMAGLGAVVGFLATMQSAFDEADPGRCADGPDGAFSSCIVQRLVHGAEAIAPTVIALALVAGAFGWTLGRLAYAPHGLRRRPRVRRLTAVATPPAAPRAAADSGAPSDGPTAERLRLLRTMPYRDYLRTPEWQRKRAVMLERAGHHCQLDARHTASLEVHHTTYVRRGDELLSDLTVLCRDCHARHHGKLRLATASPSTAPTPPLAPEPAPPLLTEPFVVPLDWTAPKPRPSLLKRLFAR